MLKRAISLLNQIKWICARPCGAIVNDPMRNNFARWLVYLSPRSLHFVRLALSEFTD